MRLSYPLGCLCAVAVAAAITRPALADPLPAGSLGIAFGGVAGTGKYKAALNAGYEFGGQAAWQPMTTEQHIGWSTKWSVVFGKMYNAESAKIDIYLRTVRLDFLAGLRLRPWASPRRYIALRGGLELLRSNEQIQPDGGRAFVGPVADAGFEQYAFGFMLLNLDVRYSLIGSGPAAIALFAGVSLSVP